METIIVEKMYQAEVRHGYFQKPQRSSFRWQTAYADRHTNIVMQRIQASQNTNYLAPSQLSLITVFDKNEEVSFSMEIVFGEISF